MKSSERKPTNLKRLKESNEVEDELFAAESQRNSIEEDAIDEDPIASIAARLDNLGFDRICWITTAFEDYLDKDIPIASKELLMATESLRPVGRAQLLNVDDFTEKWSQAVSAFADMHRDVVTKNPWSGTSPKLLEEVATETKLVSWLINFLEEGCECRSCHDIRSLSDDDKRRERYKAIAESRKPDILSRYNRLVSDLDSEFKKAFMSPDAPTRDALSQEVQSQHPDLDAFLTLLTRPSTRETCLAFPTEVASLRGMVRGGASSVRSAEPE